MWPRGGSRPSRVETFPRSHPETTFQIYKHLDLTLICDFHDSRASGIDNYFFTCSYENERARQEQLARERILARKKRRKEEHDKSEVEKLNDEENVDQKEDLVAVEQMQREGTIALQDALLNEVEKKHIAEQEVLPIAFQKDYYTTDRSQKTYTSTVD